MGLVPPGSGSTDSKPPRCRAALAAAAVAAALAAQAAPAADGAAAAAAGAVAAAAGAEAQVAAAEAVAAGAEAAAAGGEAVAAVEAETWAGVPAGGGWEAVAAGAQAGDQQGTCISVCATVRCKKGKVCKVTPFKGKPACVRVPASANPCALTLCPTGTFCTYEAGDDHATCISNCATVRCASGTCVVDKKGNPACVEEPAYNPCAATTCPVGTSCSFQEGSDQASCISNCAPVLCKPGLKCVVNKKGNPVCKKPRS
ncbi:hypothetical protein ABPG77_001693 [Micractinium sp. CCAP 211/92]